MKFLVALCSLFLISALAFSQQATVGTPWTGGKGVTQTVDQIMARSRTSEAFIPAQPRETRPEREVPMPHRTQNPKAQAVSQYPAADATSVLSVPTSPQVAGTSFLSAVVSESGFIPPDAMGAVGPTQFLVAVNGRVKVFDKAGVLGPLNATIDAFFAPALPGGSAGISDPRVRYDRLSGRWIVTAISVDTPNRVVIAVSSSSTISGTGSFTFFFFQHDLVGTTPNADTGGFLDYDAIGVDVNALYVGGNVFNAAGTAFLGTSGFVVRKSSILGAGPIVVTAFRQLAGASTAGPYTPQGVDNDDPSATEGYFIGVDNASFSLLQLRRVTNPAGTPSISGNISITVPTTTFPRTVSALGSTRPLDALDDRLFNAQIMNGSLWTVHNIRVTSAGVATTTDGTTGRDGARFYELTNLTTTPTLHQSGTLFDPTTVTTGTARHTWIPSIGVSGQNHVVITHSIAAPTNSAGTQIQPGVGHGGRLATDPLGSIQSTTITTSGAGNYNVQTTGTQRWGDYSFVSVDPNDNMTLWTAAEYSNATNSWGVRVTQMKAPLPATPFSLSTPSLNTGASNVSVSMVGTSSSGTGFYDPGAGFPNHVSATVNGGGVTVNSVTYTDPTHLTLNLSVAGNAAPGSRTITVTNPDGQSATSASGILTIVNSCPAITVLPASLPSGTTGVAYSQTITASGGASPYTFAVTSGSLPAGLSLSSGGALTGSPVSAGNYGFSITATDINGCTGVLGYSVAITCPSITLSPPTLPGGTLGVGYSQSIGATGGTSPHTFTVSAGSIPAGLTLSSGGLLSGSPTSLGSFSFTVTSTDANGCTGSQGYSISIACPTLSLSPSTLPDGTTGTAYSQTISASAGTSPYTFSVTSGTLPSGLSLSSGGNLSGSPTSAGSSSFTVTATDANGCVGSQGYSLTVTCPAIIVSPSTLPGTTISVPYNQTLSAAGGTSPYTYVVTTGALPTGLSLSSGGSITGTPTATGTFPFTITAFDANGCSGSQGYVITSSSTPCPPITVTPLTLPDGTIGTGYSQTVAATGGTAPYVFAVSTGTLPAGLTLSSGGGLSGTPGATGSSSFTVTATDANGCTGTQSYTLSVVCPTITVSPSTLPGGTAGTAYSQTVNASGGTSPYSFAVTSGSLPAGLSLSSGGALSGTPVTTGNFSFTITATDANGCTGMQSYSILVVCPTITLTPSTLPNGITGVVYSQANSATGGSSPYTFAITTGTLPTGLALSSGGGLSGTPTGTGNFSFTVTVTDVNGCTGVQAYSINVTCPVITLSPPTLPNGTTGVAYTQTITASGGTGPYTFVVDTGAVPAGTALSSAGGLTGTPVTAGVYNFSVISTDANGCTGSRVYTITVACPTIVLSPSSLPNGIVGTVYGQTITAGGGTGPYTFAMTTGSLPAGLTFSPAGNLNGSPTVQGNFVFDVTATDANGCTGVRSCSLAVACPAITVGPATLPSASIGVLYGDLVSASGGTPPYTYSVTLGAVPAGLAFSPDGSLGGVPDSAGNVSFTVTATDANGCTGSAAVSMTILASNICVSKYFDANHNQLFDQGETPMPDVTFVLDGDNQLHFEVTTDASGAACFSGITPGNYTMQEIVPPGYLVSYPASGSMSFSVGAAHDTSVVWLNGAVRDSVRYRTATMLEWATAVDRKGKLKAEKCAPVSVDFKFLVTAPVAATSLKVKLGMFTSGVLTDVAKTITYTSWAGVKEFGYSASIPAGTVLQVQGSGAKGKQIKAKLEWTKAADGRVQRADVLSYISNIPRLPMPNLHNVGLDLQSQQIFTAGFTVGNPSGTRSVIFLKYSDAQKSLNDGRGIIHDLNPACLTDGKIFKNQVKGLSPKKLKNKLFAEALALKLNIAASDQIKFTPGLGDLIYDLQGDTSLPSIAYFNGKTIRQILQSANNFLGCVSGPPQVTADDYFDVLHRINGSFSGVVDTVVWSCSKLQLKGVRALEAVPYLRANPGILPPEAFPEPVAHETGPSEFALEQNYPNPFNPTTTIGFTLPYESIVTLKVYNILGQEVATLIDNELMDEGAQESEFTADRLSSGVYLYRLTTRAVDEDGMLGQSMMRVKKLVYLK